MEAQTGWRKALRILWTCVVGASLPRGRISDWFQVKGQIESTSEDRDKAQKGPRCVPGGTPVEAPKTGRPFAHSLKQEQGSHVGPSRGPVVSRRTLTH